MTRNKYINTTTITNEHIHDKHSHGRDATQRAHRFTRNDRARHDPRAAPIPHAHISAHTITRTKHDRRQNETKKQRNETNHANEHTFTTNTPTSRLRAARSPPYTEQSRTSRHTRRATPPARRTGVARDHKYETQNTSKQDKIHGNQRIVITRGTGARDTTTPKNHPAHSTRPTVKHSRHHKRRHNSTPTPTPTLNNHTSYPPATQQPNNSTQTNPNQPKPTKPNSHTT